MSYLFFISFYRQSLYSDCKIAKDWTKPQSSTTASMTSTVVFLCMYMHSSIDSVMFYFEDVTARLEQLHQPKTLSKEYAGDR